MIQDANTQLNNNILNSFNNNNINTMQERYSLGQSRHNRRSIFNISSNKNKEKILFEDLGVNDLFEQYGECQCQKSLEACSKMLQIINMHKLQECQRRYLQLKTSSSLLSNEKIIVNLKQSLGREYKEILQPHLRGILKIIQVKNVYPLYLILKHAKSQYVTFWIYSLFCSFWPKKELFLENITNIAEINKCQLIPNQNQLTKIFQFKTSNLIQNKYAIFLRLFFKQNKFAERVAVAALMSGRTRSEDQIIRAALQLKIQ